MPGRNLIAIIGIDRYRAWPRLHNAVGDAQGALDVFLRLGFEQATAPLFDERATRNALHHLVTDDLARLSTDDSLVVFYAGHGGTKTHELAGQIATTTGYLIPVDADHEHGQVASWFRLDSWLSDVARLPPRHILVILDSCYSGIALAPSLVSRAGMPSESHNAFAKRSRRVITSARGDQRAIDGGPVPGHSLFTGWLIEGLTGGLVREGRATTTGSALGLYVQQRVADHPGSAQLPDFGTFELDDRGDMTIPLLPNEEPQPTESPRTPRVVVSDQASSGKMANTKHDRARIWFFTDIHGSNACFRKFLNAPSTPNRPNVLIIGGDITGKQVVPLVLDDNGNFHTSIAGNTLQRPISELSTISKQLSDVGCYPYECDLQQYNQFKCDPDRRKEVFDRLIAQRINEWVRLADQRLPPSEVCQVFVNAGNDDAFFVDSLLDRSTRLQRPEGKVIDLPCGLKLLSTGYCNKTPWNCTRDLDEGDLGKKIANMTKLLTPGDLQRAIFNFHCPPRNTALDLADEIDLKTLQPRPGTKGPPKIHVGSAAVREAIDQWQPLLSLHGHIHQVHAEDRLGETRCFNPGSDYRTGHMQGVFVQVDRSAHIEHAILTQERQPDSRRRHSHPIMDAILHGLPVKAQ